eukprot:CAMPEP_0176300842 /NCGR_PEP_ID=MMETSP0121_2-20121125/60540_1 /TAXON_ID=160619 /ORGANISM="Kryptoperidinium foliaceum, Strain CCMP 1326" /LENGTH=163 /DNA_ID=CAMNT_0017642263 /DNA_START=124 /DNA_END=612 /DNA_ORIENTATION=+
MHNTHGCNVGKRHEAMCIGNDAATRSCAGLSCRHGASSARGKSRGDALVIGMDPAASAKGKPGVRLDFSSQALGFGATGQGSAAAALGARGHGPGLALGLKARRRLGRGPPWELAGGPPLLRHHLRVLRELRGPDAGVLLDRQAVLHEVWAPPQEARRLGLDL